MLTMLIPKDFRKDWLLYGSAIITWSLISYLTLLRVSTPGQWLIQGVELLLFILLFFACISATKMKPQQGQALCWRIRAMLALMLLLVWLLIAQSNRNLIPILLCLIATQLPANLSRRQAMLFLLLSNLGYYLLMMHYSASGHVYIYNVLIMAMLQMFAYAATEIMIKAEQAKEQLSAINQELMATRFMLKESSKQQERLRISRDLHDVIGHQLTALSLNLEVTQHQVPAEFKATIQQSLTQAKQLLQDVRQVVKEMRSAEQLDIADTLQQLVAQLPNCQLTVVSAPEINALNLKQQLMFCLQEGISNGLRHGHASHFVLSSTKHNNRVSITLANNGTPCHDHTMGSGLQGMQERLQPYQGNATLNAQEQGCALILEMEDSYD